MSSTTLRVALAVATTLIILSSAADAFAPSSVTKLTAATTIQRSQQSSSKSTSSLLAAAASAAAPLAPTYALFGLNIAKKRKQLFTIPSIFNSADSRPIILFDGKCNLCNGAVQLILDNDRASSDSRGNLRVAALQSRVGQVLLSRLPTSDQAKVITLNSAGGAAADNNKSQYKSIVVVGPNKTWLNSAACLKIGRNLKGPLHYLALLAHIIPSFLRDPVYKLLSRYRTKLFGESPECRLWDDNWDTRFVDDGLFGGRSESDMNDPFADPNAPKVAEEVVEEDVDLLIGPNVHVGDMVRIVSTKPIVHTHVEGYKMNGLCSVGLVGRVTRVLESRAYPKNVAVRFDNVDCGGNGDEGGDVSSSLSFEAHFFPGQLRKE